MIGRSPDNRMLSPGGDYGTRGSQRLAISAKVRTIIITELRCPPSRVTEDCDFNELGADALHKTGIALAIEDAFGIKLSDREVSFFESVGTLVDLVEHKFENRRVR